MGKTINCNCYIALLVGLKEEVIENDGEITGIAFRIAAAPTFFLFFELFVQF